MKMKDITNDRFGRLTALEPVGQNKLGHFLWRCACSCGNKCVVPGYVLRKGTSKSCGCLQKESASKRLKTHGMFYKKIYAVWAGMIGRCTNEKNKDWKKYGGRGVKVEKRWLVFENFYSDMGECPTGLSLGRIDNNGDYSKANCRWEDDYKQNNNRRNNIFLTNSSGQKLTVAQWARKLNIQPYLIYSRLRRGWTVDRTLS